MAQTGSLRSSPKLPLSDSLVIPTNLTSEELNLLSLLPPLYQDFDQKILKTHEDCHEFLCHDLKVGRLNEIHDWLALAGMPRPARPLHRQFMMSRQIIITEQVDLHLVWSDSGIFIKPLPKYLLNKDFWAKHLSDDDIYPYALGLLQSYIWLVRSESDFKFAIDESRGPAILPSSLIWDRWRSFADQFPLDLKHEANKRYDFGELRLGRLDFIWRIKHWSDITHIIQGYHYGYQRYHSFFSQNFAWLIVVFAYVTVVLTAMQLGISLDSLSNDIRFQRASFGFAIFSIIVPVATVGIVVALFLILVVQNAIITWQTRRRNHLGIAPPNYQGHNKIPLTQSPA